MPKKLTREEFIDKARAIHGDKYDYSKVVYKNSNTHVCIICPIHGEFMQKPILHLIGHGCPKCGLERRVAKRTYDTDWFVAQARLVHGDKYDYPRTEYINSQRKVIITCKIHGDFWQRPIDHLKGCGCRACAGNKKLTTQEFIENAKKVHGDRFDYTGVEYKGAHIPITIVCKDCGAIINTTPHSHVVGGGCVNCRIIEHTRTKESFIEQARKVHGDKYDYDNVEYVHGETKVEIICKKHGAFLQTPNSHLQGSGCPHCIMSYGEEKVSEILNNYNIQFISQYEIANSNLFCKNKKLFVDFFLPTSNTIIEYNGQQHYEAIDYFGGQERFERQEERDNAVRQYCKEHKIKLIEIPYTEYDNIETILKKELNIKKNVLL